jgi:uncharacterized membrane protein YdjX (TVP38/TMEM64 family)
MPYGVLAAILSCFLGSCIGAVLCFLRSRYMMRDLIYVFAKRYPLVRAADRALKNNGFHLMLLLRACPVIPFNGLNHCCGITGVSLHDFTLSLVGILPFHVYTIMLGATTAHLGQNLQQDSSDQTHAQIIAFIIVMVSGGVFGLIAMVFAWRAIKRELRHVRLLKVVFVLFCFAQLLLTVCLSDSALRFGFFWGHIRPHLIRVFSISNSFIASFFFRNYIFLLKNSII